MVRGGGSGSSAAQHGTRPRVLQVFQKHGRVSKGVKTRELPIKDHGVIWDECLHVGALSPENAPTMRIMMRIDFVRKLSLTQKVGLCDETVVGWDGSQANGLP